MFVFRAGVPIKTVEGLEMPSLLSKHTEGLMCMCVSNVCVGCVHAWPQAERAAERARAAGRRQEIRHWCTHCPVNTTGSD